MKDETPRISETSDEDPRMHRSLEDLGRSNISSTSTRRLEYVLKQLEEADELNLSLGWRSELWEGVTVEELLGALIEAENLLEQSRDREALVSNDQEDQE